MSASGNASGSARTDMPRSKILWLLGGIVCVVGVSYLVTVHPLLSLLLSFLRPWSIRLWRISMYGATAAYIAPIVASAAGSIPTLAEVKRHDNAPYLLLLALLWYETITSARLDVDPAAQAAAANLATLLGPLAIYLALHVAPVLFAPTSPIPESWSIKQRGRAAFQQYLGTQDKQLAALSFGITLELLNGVILLVRLITGSYGTSFLLLMGYRHFLSWRYSNPLFVQVTASLVQQLDTYVHTAAWMPAFLRRLYYALKAALDPTISIVQALKNGASALRG